MKNLLNKIWNSSPKSWLFKLRYIYSFIYFNKKRNGVIYKTYNHGNEIKLLMPFPVPPEYESMIDGSYEDSIFNNILNFDSLDNLVIWDVGAHIGYQSLVFAASLGSNVKVISFEPNPNNVKWFKSNMLLNKKYSSKISLIENALSNKIENVNFNIGNKNNATSSGGYIDNTIPPLPESSYVNFKKILLKTNTIDDIIKTDNLLLPDIIKIDVEGAELKVLQGGIETIKKHRPELIIEIHNIPMMFHVYEFLKSLNYSIKILDEDNKNIQTKIIYAKHIQHENL